MYRLLLAHPQHQRIALVRVHAPEMIEGDENADLVGAGCGYATAMKGGNERDLKADQGARSNIVFRYHVLIIALNGQEVKVCL